MQRAQASAARLQLLNPLVAVSVDTGHVADKDEAFFAQFTLVLLSAILPSQAVRRRGMRRCSRRQVAISDLCRRRGVGVYVGHVHGQVGYLIADLGSHQFTMCAAVLYTSHSFPQRREGRQGRPGPHGALSVAIMC